MVEVLVEYDYAAKEPDELTIKKGDIIKDVIKKTGGWWEGTLNNKKGLFPDNFVKLLDKDANVVLRNKKDLSRIRQCRVVFSYHQDHEDELNLKVGDVINILGEEEEGWWRGVLNGKEGVFPSNFVEEIPHTQTKPRPSSRDDLIRISDEAPSLPAKPAKQLCEVRYSYKAQNEDELSLKEGDIVTLLNKDGQDPGWWKGEINGRIGVFPDNFVVLLPSPSDDKKLASGKVDNKHPSEPSAIKPSSVASQRKSLEFKNNPPPPKPETKTTPPLPGKKPLISLKKSPSSSGSGGLFSKIKDKIVDAVDGATGSKPKTEVAVSAKENPTNDSVNTVFDQVERRPLLNDVRANRARAPGRRLPTSIYKEDDEEVPGLPNGVDHHKTENSVKSEDSFKSEASVSSENLDNSSSSELDTSETKPKLREWEKHKAPWLAEMKLNQAKRTSVSPVPDLRSKLVPAAEPKPDPEISKSSQSSPVEKEVNLVDMSKSMSDIKVSPVELKPISKPYKTPPNELDKAPPIKSKPVVPVSSVNRNSLGSAMPLKDSPSKPIAPLPIKIPPRPKPEVYENVTIEKPPHPTIATTFGSPSSVVTTTNRASSSSSSSFVSVSSSSSSVIKSAQTGFSSTTLAGLGHAIGLSQSLIGDSTSINDNTEGTVSLKQFHEMLERLRKLEERCDKQEQQIEDLKNRLQVETDMRMLLQEKVMQNNVQV